MKRIISILAIALLTLSGPAFAHGDMDHVMGTVTKTTYEANGTVGKQTDLLVGDRVVIHAMKMDGKETAHTVRLVHPHK